MFKFSVAVMALICQVTGQNDISLINPKASSEYETGTPYRVLSKVPRFSARWPGTCYHSNLVEDKHIWQAQFEKPTLVSSVSVLSRLDCCDYRIKGTRVYIDDFECGVLDTKGRGKWIDVQCGNETQGVMGKNIILVHDVIEGESRRDQALNFCGIKVSGQEVEIEGQNLIDAPDGSGQQAEEIVHKKEDLGVTPEQEAKMKKAFFIRINTPEPHQSQYYLEQFEWAQELIVGKQDHLICGMKAKSDPAIGITQLYVKMCKLSLWAMQTEYIQFAGAPRQLENAETTTEEPEDNDKEEDKPEEEENVEEDETFAYTTCGINEYVKGLGFKYQESKLGLEPQQLTDVAIQCGQFKGKTQNSEWKSFNFSEIVDDNKHPEKWYRFYSSEDMGVCAIQSGHLVDGDAKQVPGITNMNFKQCMIEVQQPKSVQELIPIIMIIGATVLVTFIFLSGLIYKYYCGLGPNLTPQPDPQSLKQMDASALELANNMHDQESPDKQENPEVQRETDHESLDQISQESNYIEQKRQSVHVAIQRKSTKVNKSIHEDQEHITE